MITVLKGDSQQVLEHRDSLIVQFLKTNDELGLLSIDPDDSEVATPQYLFNNLTSGSLFGEGQKMVIMTSLFRRFNENALEDLLSKVSQNIHLVILEHDKENDTQEEDDREETEGSNSRYKKYLSVLKKHSGDKNYHNYTGIKDINQWIVDTSTKFNSRISKADANYLNNRLSGNTSAIYSSIQKLSAYDSITRDLIDELVDPAPQTVIFSLFEAISDGNRKKAAMIYKDQRMQKNTIYNIMGLVAWQVHILVIAALNFQRSGYSDAGLSKQIGVHAYPVKKSRILAANLGARKVRELVDLCLEVDKKMRLSFLNANQEDQLMDFFIQKGCSICKR